MSFHDTRLRAPKAKARTGAFKRGIASGAFSFTLFPKSPALKFGSVRDDWRAVGRDISSSMDKFSRK